MSGAKHGKLLSAHLANLEKEEFDTATAKSLYEDEELLVAGFEYVAEWDGVKIISRPE